MTGIMQRCKNFNPRSREGSDALAIAGAAYKMDFNPRSREGSDDIIEDYVIGSGKFQSTLPRGERHHRPQVKMLQNYFNPRSREGSDYLNGQEIPTIRNFNPRSREGSDPVDPVRERSCPYFNPRSREGSDLIADVQPGFRCDFNPRSREGSDVFQALPGYHLEISIHAPARGATSILSKIHPMFLTISHNASSFSSFPFHSFLPHLLNSSTFCALFQVRISRAFSVYYRFAPKKSTPDL